MSDSGLFEYDQGSLPNIQASETLYSWCARFHRLSGHSRASSTCRLLFGHPTTGLHHDFPGRLDYLSEASHNTLGTAEHIILQRSQFGLFAPFLSEGVGTSLIEAMRTGVGSIIRKRLGIFRSGLRPSTPLKACRQCINEDRDTTPTSWWRIEHQWLPSWICLRHGEALMNAPNYCYPARPCEWYLPDEFSSGAWQTVRFSRTQFKNIADITRWTTRIIAERPYRFDAELLRYTYHLRAQERGWVAFDGSLRFHTMRDAFRRKFLELEHFDGQEFLQTTTNVNGGFLGHLLREHPGARHPQKHIYLMAFLFEEPEQLLEVYESARNIVTADGLEGMKSRLTDTRAQLSKMVEDGKSVNSASLELGVPPSMAIRHLKASGVKYGQRPRVLTKDLETTLCTLLSAGKTRDEIASALKIRKSFIKNYLAEQPELKHIWMQALLSNKKAIYRAHFLRILDEHPGVPIKRIRRLSDSGFEWLYRNDLEWLQSNLPGIWHRP